MSVRDMASHSWQIGTSCFMHGGTELQTESFGKEANHVVRVSAGCKQDMYVLPLGDMF